MGKFSRDKGGRAEREIVARHLALGVHAERVPLSGACGGSFAGDVIIPGIGTVEVKCRAGGAGFRTGLAREKWRDFWYLKRIRRT